MRSRFILAGKGRASLCSAIAAGLSSLFMAGTSADDHQPEQVLSLYHVANGDAADGVRIADERVWLTRLQSGAYGKPRDFSLEARVAFKTERRRAVADAHILTFTQPPAGLQEGWSRSGAIFTWQGKAHEPVPAVLPLDLGSGESAFHLGEFEELWIDYSPSPGIAVCKPQVQFRLEPRRADPKRELLAQTSDRDIEPLVVLNAERANWKPKGLSYLARRTLGLSADDDWRYSQDQTNAVLQRRLALPLNDLEMFDIVVSKGTQIKQVNLRVSADNDRDEIIEVPQGWAMPVMPDGTAGLQLHLPTLLARRFPVEWAENVMTPGRHRFLLKEVLIFVPGEASVVAAARAVRELKFLGQPRTTDERIVTLASSLHQVSRSQWRMAVNLESLTARHEFDTKSATLGLVPPSGAPFCAITINRVQAVRTYNDSVLPLFARRIEDWSRRWGGPFSGVEPRDGEVEDPGIVGYLPLSMLAQPDGAAEEDVELASENDSDEHVQMQSQPASIRAYRIAGPVATESSPSLRSSGGAVMTAEGSMPTATAAGDRLVLQGRSKALDFFWPVKAQLSENSFFFFGVDEGSTEIENATLSLDLGGRTWVKEHVRPNQPLALPTGSRAVHSVTLRIVPTRRSFRYVLREIALFAPRATTYAKAFAVALPRPYLLLPKPQPEGNPPPNLESEPGHIAGLTSTLAGATQVRFSTTLEPALDWIQRIHVQYRLPTASGDAARCPLALRFNWERGTTDRRLCPDKSVGNLYIHMSEWLRGIADPQSLGRLQSIDWSLDLGKESNQPYADFFDLRFSIEGFGMTSAADQLRRMHMFDNAGLGTLATTQLASGAERIWLPLDDRASTRIITDGLQPIDHSLFTVDRVIAKPKKPMSPEHWGALTEPAPSEPTPARWPELLVLGLLIFAGAATLKMGRFIIMRRRPAYASGALLRASKQTLLVGFQWLWRQRSPTLPILALIGVWFAGYEQMNFRGAMSLTASALLLFGAYCGRHEQALQAPQMHQAVNCIRVAILIPICGCLLWSLVRYGRSIEVIWGLVPALAAAYAFSPPLSPWQGPAPRAQALLARYRIHASFVACLSIAAAMYAIGINDPHGGGENYFFTFGALMAALAAHALVRLIEQRVRARFSSLGLYAYSGPGTCYFLATLLLLALLVTALAFNWTFAAKQLGVMMYFLLVLGTAREIFALRSRP